MGRIKKPLTRKERRKQERSARKQRTAIFHSRNKSHVDFSEQNAHRIKKKPQKTGKTDVTINRNHFNVKKTSDDDKEEERKSKKVTASQSSAMMRENKEIARLEKLLKMKKRKKLPTLFKEEGLDCIPPIPHLALTNIITYSMHCVKN